MVYESGEMQRKVIAQCRGADGSEWPPLRKLELRIMRCWENGQAELKGISKGFRRFGSLTKGAAQLFSGETTPIPKVASLYGNWTIIAKALREVVFTQMMC